MLYQVVASLHVIEDRAPEDEESAVDPQRCLIDRRDVGDAIVFADLRKVKGLIVCRPDQQHGSDRLAAIKVAELVV